MTWKPDPREDHIRRFGEITLVSEVHSKTNDTAHLVTFADGSQIRVLPDGSSGQRRARAVRDTLHAAAALSPDNGDVVETYVIGRLHLRGLTWEQVGDLGEVTIEEWLVEWLEAGGSAAQLLEDLDVDGWQITRKEN